MERALGLAALEERGGGWRLGSGHGHRGDGAAGARIPTERTEEPTARGGGSGGGEVGSEGCDSGGGGGGRHGDECESGEGFGGGSLSPSLPANDGELSALCKRAPCDTLAHCH